MIAFPVVSALVSALCCVVLIADQIRKPRADKFVWAIAFFMFALAAGTDAWGREMGWNENLARLYYATGPALVVLFLAVGELYLLFPERMGRFAPGVTILLSAVWMTAVLDADIDSTALKTDGWEAIERAGVLRTLAISINSIGTLIIVGGLAWSIWKFWKAGSFRNRMIGCSLIAVGTITVGLGGTLTRFGHYEYLYIAMSVGVSLIFAGVIWTRRPDVRVVKSSPVDTAQQEGVALVPVNAEVLSWSDAEIDRFCTEWSVPRENQPHFARKEAIRAWRFRTSLSHEARSMFDAHSVPARRQIVTLFDEVIAQAQHETTSISD